MEHDALCYHRKSVTLTPMWLDLWNWAEQFFQTYFVTVAEDDGALYAELLDLLAPTAMAVMDLIETLLYAPHMRSEVYLTSFCSFMMRIWVRIFSNNVQNFHFELQVSKMMSGVLESVEQQTKMSSTLHLVPPDHVKVSLFTAVSRVQDISHFILFMHVTTFIHFVVWTSHHFRRIFLKHRSTHWACHALGCIASRFPKYYPTLMMFCLTRYAFALQETFWNEGSHEHVSEAMHYKALDYLLIATSYLPLPTSVRSFPWTSFEKRLVDLYNTINCYLVYRSVLHEAMHSIVHIQNAKWFVQYDDGKEDRKAWIAFLTLE
ncbi:uncharacterized protein EV420DRAFT_1649115 [Desarmillaria tabescens]|uniref:Uncharacterized protein n=1 Tax=Armillaria tabescens TaxID=1929756 RepID=A0AA39JNG2_ARMTA|nr:uncharacterized protein EV420DRAFT_1649115 [Desarmillaria tabescens]KAK0443653.1 hypothetical protein EV420DRAFT_1649115 [Desarmillaria tabescens]